MPGPVPGIASVCDPLSAGWPGQPAMTLRGGGRMSYDLVVIGSGPGGYVCAIRAAQLGLKTAVRREARDAWRHLPQCRLHPVQGAAARLGAVRGGAARISPSMGIEVGDAEARSAQMMAPRTRASTATSRASSSCSRRTRSTRFRGTGRIAAPGKVEVDGEDGRAQTLEAKEIVIATGSDVDAAARRRDRREARSSPRPARWRSTRCRSSSS